MGLRAASGDAALAKAVRRNYRFITRVANSLGAELNPVYGYARHYRPGLCAGVEHPAAPRHTALRPAVTGPTRVTSRERGRRAALQ